MHTKPQNIEARNIRWSNPALMARHGARYAELFQSIFGKSTP
jgi:hypothetical protein